MHRNGVRPYLDVRMPTFHLSDGDVGVLEKSFQPCGIGSGTDLTGEGSKPIERLDFALLTHEA